MPQEPAREISSMRARPSVKYQAVENWGARGLLEAFRLRGVFTCCGFRERNRVFLTRAMEAQEMA